MDRQNRLIRLAFGLLVLVGNITIASTHDLSRSEEYLQDTGRVYADNNGVGNPVVSDMGRHLKSLGIKPRTSIDQINRFYKELNAHEPNMTFAWLTAEGALSDNGRSVYQALSQSNYAGLIPEMYHLTTIDALRKQDHLDREARIRLDVLLTESALSYVRDLASGRPELMRADKDWLLERKKIDPVRLVLTAIISDSMTEIMQTAEPQHQAYHQLKKALNNILSGSLSVAAEPQLTEGAKLVRGSQGVRVQELRTRLVYLGVLEDAHKQGMVFDAALEHAVKAFQKAHFLEPDGVVGVRTQKEINLSKQDRLRQIIVNLERWRWMPETLGVRYLVVDIPGFEYYIIEEGKEVMRAKTVVGMAQRSTPVFMAPMNHIVFSPYWNIPRSMAIKDKLPQLKRDPYRLARSKIRVIDSNGNEIDPAMIDWSQYNANNFPYRLRQDPGSYNALGRVKFMFPNKHAIYLHDTPQKSLFSKTERTFSSGCIRVENPIELAEYFLKNQNWSKERVVKAYNGQKENTVRLKEDMRFQVYTLYMTVSADAQGEITFRPDIYNRDQAMIRVLKQLEKESA